MLTILHISDVHFGAADHLGAQPLITDALIKAVHDSGIEPDLCVFTGDLAFDGSNDQLQKGNAWLRRLIRSNWTTELIVIPGNHDIQRAAAQPHLFRAIAANENSYNDWRRSAEANSSHLGSFFNWYSSAVSSLPLRGQWQKPFGFHYHNSSFSVPFHVIGLNSAMFCCNDSDEGNLVIDTRTLTSALEATTHVGGLVIAAAHHPLEHLAKWNREHIEMFLSQETGAHIFLHGHLHEQLGATKGDSTGQRLTTLAAGAAYQDARWPYAFSFYTVDFTEHAIFSQAYSYSPNSGAWTQDTKNSRKIMVDLPAIRKQTARRSQPKADARNLTIHPPTHARAGTDEDGQINREACWRFREAAREAQLRLISFLRESSEISDNSYAIKYRIKEFDSIVRKLNARLADDNTYSLNRMADICGFRIITMYQDQIPPIIAFIIDTIARQPHASPFVKGRELYIDVNTSRTDTDPLSITPRIRSVAAASSINPRVEVRNRATGYSSVHVIASVSVPRGAYQIDEMLVEIQLRSALEDVWGEIDHKLRYGSQRGDVGISWSNHLNIFKAMIDALVQYVDLIKSHSEQGSPQPPADVQHIRTVESPTAQMERLKELPASMRTRLAGAYDTWKQADATLDRGGDVGLFRTAADAFSALLPDANNLSDETPGLKEELLYTVQAESAYMLMYTGDEGDLLKSEQIYKDILSVHQNDATANFRLGQVYRRSRVYDKAIEHLRRAVNIIERGEDARINKRHWVYDESRRVLATVYWYMFNGEALSLELRREALSSALKISYDVMQTPAEGEPRRRASVTNDFLYFVWDANRIGLNIKAVIGQSVDTIALGDELYNYLMSNDDGRYNIYDTVLRYVGADCKKAIPIALKEEVLLEAHVLTTNPTARLPERGTPSWVVVVAGYLRGDDERADALAYCEEVLARCGRTA